MLRQIKVSVVETVLTLHSLLRYPIAIIDMLLALEPPLPAAPPIIIRDHECGFSFWEGLYKPEVILRYYSRESLDRSDQSD